MQFSPTNLINTILWNIKYRIFSADIFSILAPAVLYTTYM